MPDVAVEGTMETIILDLKILKQLVVSIQHTSLYFDPGLLVIHATVLSIVAF